MMLRSIFYAETFSLPAVLMAILTALVLGIAVAYLYMNLGTYRKSFVVILAALPMLVSMVIMIVNGNLGASVAVLGAFGLVRFRSAPGSARDIGFIFFAMAIGLATGMGFLSMAVLMTGIISAALIILQKSAFAKEDSTLRTLRITVPEDLNYVGAFDDLMRCFTSQYRLMSVKTTNMGTMYELNYQVVMQEAGLEKVFLDALRCRNGNLTILLGMAANEKEAL